MSQVRPQGPERWHHCTGPHKPAKPWDSMHRYSPARPAVGFLTLINPGKDLGSAEIRNSEEGLAQPLALSIRPGADLWFYGEQVSQVKGC